MTDRQGFPIHVQPAKQEGVSLPEIHPSEIECNQIIGSGSFGKVYRGKCRGKDVAIKMLHKPITDEKTLATFKKEVAIMSTIFHPNICLFMGACTMPGHFFIVSEYLPRGDMEKLLRDKNVQFSLYTRLKMAKDAALGMNWLHRSNPMFIHRDLKSSNLLVDESGRVKVCDFGLSQIKPQGQSLKDVDSAKGTPLWMAPEVMQFKEFNEKCDVYSFGIVLWEILTRQEPFPHHTNFEKFRHAVCVAHERPAIPTDCDSSLRDLIQRSWMPQPSMRPSFEEIVQRLDQVLVNVAVSDPFGRQFWTQAFPGQDEVAWPTFVGAFTKFLLLPPLDLTLLETATRDPNVLNMKCLRAILAEKSKSQTKSANQEVVSLEKFGRILNWFGPITDPSHTPQGATFLDNTRKLLAQPWFHGDTTTEEAQERLSGKLGGTFLIRFSSVDGWYTISQITEGRAIRHQRVKHRPGFGYSVDGVEYDSLEHLVNQRQLLSPCTGSRYQAIFQENPPAIYGYVSNNEDTNF